MIQRIASILGACALAACSSPSTPPAPTVNAPPALTNESPLSITGAAEAAARVQVRGGAGGVAEAIAEADGTFRVTVELNADASNTLLVSQVVDGLESPAATVMVTHDGMPPAAPTVDPVTSPTRLDRQTIRGTTEAGATVSITGGLEDASGTADASGAFAIEVMLASSASMAVENALSVVATDGAGNASAAAEATITFDPTLAVEAPTLDGVPAVTREATITISGTAEAGVGITAVGGATDGSAVVGASGTFSVDVGLRPNQNNTILVFAVSGVDTSPAATLVVRHDDISPVAPILDAQASPTGADVVRLTGRSEGGAEIAVTGGAGAASGTANEVGDFAIDVMLAADATNDLSVTATDAAGNASEAATLSIVQDSTLEAPITVDPVMSPTSNPTVRLAGRASASIEIHITGGAATVMTMSDASGDWSADVTLSPNRINELRITRPTSGVDTIVSIEHDDIAPSAPAANPLPSPTGDTMITVTGTTEASARVSVSGAGSPVAVTAGADGRFSAAVVIATDAETTLTIISTDRAGNSSAPTTLRVTHSSSIPDAPTLDETNPPPTSAATYTVSGQVAEPGASVMVRITGGTTTVTGMTDPTSGRFSEEVTLNANAANELSVVSVDGAIESAAALVAVVHDDVAPTAPAAGSITASAAGCVAGISTGGSVAGSGGAVEGRARVRVENVTRSTSATTTATDGGAFTVSIGICTGNVIRITATDAAGNVSAATEVTGS